MNWFEQHQQMSVREREDFSRILNRLLASTFVVKRQEEARKDFYFIERHETIFRSYLEILGWDLILDRVYGVCQVVSRQGSHRISLRLVDSLLLLILRLLYEEKRKEISLTADVVILVQEIQDKYLALKIRGRPIEKKNLRDAFSLFRRFDLVEVLDSDVTDPECRILVYPSILFVVKLDSLQEIHARIEAYQEGSAGEDEVAEQD